MADSEQEPLPRLFWWFFTAGVVSWLGDGVIVVGFPLLAAGLTRSPLGIAAVIVTQRVAPMLLSLPAGALADRWNPRVTAVCTNLAQAALFAVAAALVAGHHLGLLSLIVVAFLADALGTLFTCANGVLLASVVAPAQFGAANTWLRAANMLIAFVVGPGVGGLLYATGRQLPLIVDACSFAAAAAVLATLRLPHAAPRPPRTARRSFPAEVRQGVRITFGSAPMRLMTCIVATMTLAQAGSVATIVVLGTHTVGLGKTGFGWALAAGNVTAVGVMLSIGRVGRLRTSSAVLVSLALGIGGEVLLGTARSGPQISVGLAMDAGATLIIGIALATARMRLVPREQLGRLTGGYQTVIFGTGAVGTLLGGALAEASPRLPYLVCATVYALVLGVVFRRVRRLDERPDEGADPVPVPVPVSLPSPNSAPQDPAEKGAEHGRTAVLDSLDVADSVAAGEVVD
jgi:MFS family permease